MKIFSVKNKSKLMLLINLELLGRSDPVSCFNINIYNASFNIVGGASGFRVPCNRQHYLVGTYVIPTTNIVKTYVRYFVLNFYFSPNDSPSKAMKNIFNFI